MLARGSSVFKVVMDLTADGLENAEKIVKHVFQVHLS